MVLLPCTRLGTAWTMTLSSEHIRGEGQRGSLSHKEHLKEQEG